MGPLLVTLCVLAPALPQVPVLHEESFLASSQDDSTAFVSIALEGNRLAAYGFGADSEEHHVLQKEGRTWVSEFEQVFLGGFASGLGVTGFEKDRFVLSGSEDENALVYRRVDDTWELEHYIWPSAGWARLSGNRLVTTSQFSSPRDPIALTLWKHEAAGWVQDETIVPDAPQSNGRCCFPVDLWGNTLAFAALDATGTPSVQVYVRTGGRWQKEAVIVPSPGAFSIGDVDLWGGKLALLVYENRAVFAATAYVFERERGAWRQTARLFPDRLTGSAALEEDTLVLTENSDEVSPTATFVVERDRGGWIPTYDLRASDGLALGRALAVEGRTVAVASHRRPDLPGRIYFFRLPPFARANAYGCGVNPPGSLVVLSGRPALGETLTLGLSNPLGTQPSGSIGYLGLARRADPEFPCGTPFPGLGMDGGPGEWLLRRDPAFFMLVRQVGVLADPAQPLSIELDIPADPALIGHHFFVQGALRDPRPGAPVPWGLSTALELSIGR